MSSITDCCPECGASLAECHIGDAVCPECGAVVGDGGDVEIADIRPRVTQAGDELCDYVETCPQRARTSDGCDYCSHEETYCKLLDEWVVDETICPVAARRTARELADAIGQTDLYKERIQQLYASHARKDVELARLRVEVEAWRSGRLDCAHEGRFYVAPNENAGPRFYNTIDDAVDALIAEREGVTP